MTASLGESAADSKRPVHGGGSQERRPGPGPGAVRRHPGPAVASDDQRRRPGFFTRSRPRGPRGSRSDGAAGDGQVDSAEELWGAREGLALAGRLTTMSGSSTTRSWVGEPAAAGRGHSRRRRTRRPRRPAANRRPCRRRPEAERAAHAITVTLARRGRRSLGPSRRKAELRPGEGSRSRRRGQSVDDGQGRQWVRSVGRSPRGCRRVASTTTVGRPGEARAALGSSEGLSPGRGARLPVTTTTPGKHREGRATASEDAGTSGLCAGGCTRGSSGRVMGKR